MFDLHWDLWVFILAVVVAIAIMRFLRNLGKLALALVLYFGTVWAVYAWLQWLFWIAVVLTLLGFIGWFATRAWRWRAREFSLARTGSTVTLVLALIFALSGGVVGTVVGNVVNGQGPDIDAIKAALSADIKQQLDTTNAAVKAEAAARATEHAEFWAAIKKLEENDKKQDKAIADLQKRVTALEEDDGTPSRGTTRTPTASDTTPEAVADALADDLAEQGWTDVTVGTVDWSRNTSDATVGAYGPRIDTHARLANAIKTNREIRAHVANASMPAKEKARALRGEGYVPVQFEQDDVCFNGNMLINANGKPVRGKPNCVQRGDIVWVYVGTDGKVYWDAAVRADCANPGMIQPPTPRKKAQICPPGTDRAGQMKGTKPCDTPDTPATPGTTSPPTTGTPSSTPPTPGTSTTTVPTSTTSTTTKPSKDPSLHQCYPTPKPGCPTDPPASRPAPTNPPDPSPSNTPDPTYTTSDPPKPTATATTITQPPATRTTSAPVSSPSVTTSLVPKCPDPNNPACDS